MTDAPTRQALVVRGGWEGHEPVAATDRFIPFLEENGFAVEVSDTLDAYLDADRMAATDLVLQIWTMGEITQEQVISAARRARTRAVVVRGRGVA